MKDDTFLIYITPNYNFDEGKSYEEIVNMTQKERYDWAHLEESDEVWLFDDLESFTCAFNNEEISDLGYIFVGRR